MFLGIVLKPFRKYFDDIVSLLSNLARLGRPSSPSVYDADNSICLGEYIVHWQVLNAADFGVAQIRRRVFIVCIRRDAMKRSFKFPIASHSESALLASQFGSRQYWDEHSATPPYIYNRRLKDRASELEKQPITGTKRWRTIRDIIAFLPPPGSEPRDPWHNQRDGAKIYKGHTGSLLDFPAKTIKAGVHGVPGGENMIRFTENRVRYLTIRECAMVQAFPQSYVFAENFSRSMQLVGNAVPTALASAVIDAVIRSIN